MTPELARADVDRMTGPVVLEFGSEWCPICRAARPFIDRALAEHPDVRHLKVEDGKGKPLGRSFRVTLWPTLVFLRDGYEVARLVRPSGPRELEEALEAIGSVHRT